MPRKPKYKPFQQKRQPYAPYRKGKQVAYYVPDDLQRAIIDVARARGNISRSELVCSILAAHPEIAAQLELYRAMQDMGSDTGLDGNGPDAGEGKQPDQERGGLWEDIPTLGPSDTSPDAWGDRERGQEQKDHTDQKPGAKGPHRPGAGKRDHTDQKPLTLVAVG